MPKFDGKKPGPGRPKTDPETRAAFKLTKVQILETLTYFMSMDINSLRALLQDDTKPVFFHIMGAVALKAIEDGCDRRLNMILDRAIGKVTDKIEHSMPKPVVIEYESGQKVYLGAAREEEE